MRVVCAGCLISPPRPRLVPLHPPTVLEVKLGLGVLGQPVLLLPLARQVVLHLQLRLVGGIRLGDGLL